MASPPSTRHDREAHLLAGLREGLLPYFEHLEKGGLPTRKAMARLLTVAEPIYEGVVLAGRELRVAIALERHDLPLESERLIEIRKRGE